MQSGAGKAALAIGAVAIVVVLFVALNSGGNDKSASNNGTTTTGAAPKNAIPVIVLRDGKPVGGIKKLSYTKGDQIRFAVEPDVDGDIHVHGFDIEKSGKAGATTRFSFPANIEGAFDVEDHGSDAHIAVISVNP